MLTREAGASAPLFHARDAQREAAEIAQTIAGAASCTESLAAKTRSQAQRAAVGLLDLAALLIADDGLERGAKALTDAEAASGCEDLAKETGIEPGALEAMRRGNLEPTDDERTALADALGDNRLLNEWKHAIPAGVIFDTIFGSLQSVIYGSFIDCYRGTICHLLTASMQYDKEKGRAE